MSGRQVTHFKAAMAVVAAMSAAFALTDPIAKMDALNKIGAPRSRGKGKNKGFIKSWFSQSAYNRTGRYDPAEEDRRHR